MKIKPFWPKLGVSLLPTSLQALKESKDNLYLLLNVVYEVVLVLFIVHKFYTQVVDIGQRAFIVEKTSSGVEVPTSDSFESKCSTSQYNAPTLCLKREAKRKAEVSTSTRYYYRESDFIAPKLSIASVERAIYSERGGPQQPRFSSAQVLQTKITARRPPVKSSVDTAPVPTTATVSLNKDDAKATLQKEEITSASERNIFDSDISNCSLDTAIALVCGTSQHDSQREETNTQVAVSSALTSDSMDPVLTVCNLPPVLITSNVNLVPTNACSTAHYSHSMQNLPATRQMHKTEREVSPRRTQYVKQDSNVAPVFATDSLALAATKAGLTDILNGTQREEVPVSAASVGVGGIDANLPALLVTNNMECNVPQYNPSMSFLQGQASQAGQTTNHLQYLQTGVDLPQTLTTTSVGFAPQSDNTTSQVNLNNRVQSQALKRGAHDGNTEISPPKAKYLKLEVKPPNNYNSNSFGIKTNIECGTQQKFRMPCLMLKLPQNKTHNLKTKTSALSTYHLKKDVVTTDTANVSSGTKCGTSQYNPSMPLLLTQVSQPDSKDLKLDESSCRKKNLKTDTAATQTFTSEILGVSSNIECNAPQYNASMPLLLTQASKPEAPNFKVDESSQYKTNLKANVAVTHISNTEGLGLSSNIDSGTTEYNPNMPLLLTQVSQPEAQNMRSGESSHHKKNLATELGDTQTLISDILDLSSDAECGTSQYNHSMFLLQTPVSQYQAQNRTLEESPFYEKNLKTDVADTHSFTTDLLGLPPNTECGISQYNGSMPYMQTEITQHRDQDLKLEESACAKDNLNTDMDFSQTLTSAMLMLSSDTECGTPQYDPNMSLLLSQISQPETQDLKLEEISCQKSNAKTDVSDTQTLISDIFNLSSETDCDTSQYNDNMLLLQEPAVQYQAQDPNIEESSCYKHNLKTDVADTHTLTRETLYLSSNTECNMPQYNDNMPFLHTVASQDDAQGFKLEQPTQDKKNLKADVGNSNTFASDFFNLAAQNDYDTSEYNRNMTILQAPDSRNEGQDLDLEASQHRHQNIMSNVDFAHVVENLPSNTEATCCTNQPGPSMPLLEAQNSQGQTLVMLEQSQTSEVRYLEPLVTVSAAITTTSLDHLSAGGTFPSNTLLEEDPRTKSQGSSNFDALITSNFQAVTNSNDAIVSNSDRLAGNENLFLEKDTAVASSTPNNFGCNYENISDEDDNAVDSTEHDTGCDIPLSEILDMQNVTGTSQLVTAPNLSTVDLGANAEIPQMKPLKQGAKSPPDITQNEKPNPLFESSAKSVNAVIVAHAENTNGQLMSQELVKLQEVPANIHQPVSTLNPDRPSACISNKEKTTSAKKKTLLAKMKILKKKMPIANEKALTVKEKKMTTKEIALRIKKKVLMAKAKSLIAKEKSSSFKEKATIAKKNVTTAKEKIVTVKEKAITTKDEIQLVDEGATTTKEKAKIAKEKATTVKEKVTTAKEKATTAKEKATTVKKEIITVKENAITAKDEIQLANEGVTTSKEKATTKERATTAKDKAITAKDEIQLANEVATTAKEKAATTKERATASKEKAITAKDELQLANEGATTAKEKTTTTKERATASKEKAITAKDELQLANVGATTAKEKSTSAKAKATLFNEKVSTPKEKVELAKEKATTSKEDNQSAKAKTDYKCNFFRSARGRRTLVVDDIRYRINNVGPDKIRWRCSSHERFGCKARVHTMDNKIVYFFNEHTTSSPRVCLGQIETLGIIEEEKDLK